MNSEEVVEKIIVVSAEKEVPGIINDIFSEKEFSFFIAPDFQSGMRKINQINGVISKKTKKTLDEISNKREGYLDILEDIKERAINEEFKLLSQATIGNNLIVQEKIVKNIMARDYIVLTEVFLPSSTPAISSTLNNKLKKMFYELPEHINKKYKKQMQSLILMLLMKKIQAPLGLYILTQCFKREVPCLIICNEPPGANVDNLISLLHFSQSSSKKVSKRTIKNLFYTIFRNTKHSWVNTVIKKKNIYIEHVTKEGVQALNSILY